MTATDTPAPNMPIPAQERAQDGASWPTITVPLTYPVTAASGALIKSVTFREPDVGALEAIDALDIREGERLKLQHLRAIAGVLSGHDPDDLRRIHARDFARLAEALAPFLEIVGAPQPPSGP